MKIETYLSRIGYGGPFVATHEVLRGLQAAHLLSVPFENLDIVPLHRPIRLDEASLWEKLVIQRRGGFCYELNGLFGGLLTAAGFDVTYLDARVFRRDGSLGIDFDHLALLVRLPGDATTWLADVGFGDFSLEPLPLQEGESAQGLRAYRLESTSDGFVTWQRQYNGTWERQYFFDLKAHAFPAEYLHACEYHQRSPDSSFTRRAVISQATKYGRITLEPERLIVTDNGVRKETALKPNEWPLLLREHFGIVLPQT